MLTTIHFIGLIVTTLVTGPPAGAQLIMGNFPATLPPHMRIIAYPLGSRVNPNSEWPKNGSFTTTDRKTFDYVQVTLENIAITGPTQAFNNQLGAMPHLTCCCTPFNAGFNPVWGNPSTPAGTKKSAFFNFSNGTYTTVTEPTGAISTVLIISDNVNITFTGTIAASSKKLVLKPGTEILVANEPRCVIEGTTCPPMHGTDFLSYYMMGNGTQNCTATPSSQPACAPQTAACPTTGSAPAARPAPVLSAVHKKALANLHSFYVDVNCSDTGWP